jgi:hypothetical protein
MVRRSGVGGGRAVPLVAEVGFVLLPYRAAVYFGGGNKVVVVVVVVVVVDSGSGSGSGSAANGRPLDRG